MQVLGIIVELIYVSLFDNKVFKREKRVKPSLLAQNIAWFTTCSWVEQLNAFDQLHRFETNKV